MDLSSTVKDLETFKGALEKQCKNMFLTAKKQKDEIDAAGQKSLEYTNEKAEKIIKGAEAKRNLILSGITAKKEELNKQVEVLKAEKKLLEAAKIAGFVNRDSNPVLVGPLRDSS